jgi:hypothetical protein
MLEKLYYETGVIARTKMPELSEGSSRELAVKLFGVPIITRTNSRKFPVS